MNPGDLKNTFVDKDGIERTVVIPAEVFRAARREKISNKLAIQRFLADAGYLDQTVVQNTTTAEAQQRKKRTRKPNETKRAIINQLADCIADAGYDDKLEITNPERQFRFEIDGKTYEVTLVQKRK